MSTILLPPVAPPPPVDPDAGAASVPVDPELVAYQARFRRRMFWWSLVPVILVVLLAVKLLSLPAFAGVSQATYGAKQYDRSVAAADGLGIANVFEPWVHYFDRGAALAQIGVLVDARTELETALRRVPVSNVAASCMVRTDLALVVEQQGDSAVLDGTFATAETFYKHALALIDAAPDGCFDDPDSSKAPPAKKPLDDAKTRLQQKQQQAEQNAGGSQGNQGQGGTDQGGQDPSGGSQSGQGGDQGSSGGSSSQDPLDKLQQQNGDAQKDQQQNNDRNRYFKENPQQYDGKPW